MKPLNIIPIEDFLNKARVAVKSNQKSITLDIKEVQSLHDSLAIVMTRLSGELDQIIGSIQQSGGSTQVKMDGGNF
jgi:hypothetical protein